MDKLYDKLISYNKEDYYPMHMPGHKRNTTLMPMVNPYGIDITEIEGFDNLHQAEGILKELSERISRLYGAGKSFPLINGSTAGILAGISAATTRGDQVLLVRNCHKSVYHGVVLRGLEPIYCYPQKTTPIPINGGILSSEIEELLITYPGIKLVIITSPTYEGVVSDVKAIAEVVHRHQALLMVDEAHGAHFGFHEKFPKSAVTLDADLVIQSLHKTLPAFTQTAVLHSNNKELNHKIEQYLAIYESSSPSYLLMAGIDRCISMLEDDKELFPTFVKRLERFYDSMEALNNLKIANETLVGQNGVYHLDPSKITISTKETSISGHQLQEILREKYHIIMEMEAPDYVLGMTSICDTEEGFDRLTKALLAIDKDILLVKKDQVKQTELVSKPVQEMIPQEALEQPTEQIKLQDSVGRISAAFISLFPPGAPILVPGERIEQELLDYIKGVKQKGIMITGLFGEQRDEIVVINIAKI